MSRGVRKVYVAKCAVCSKVETTWNWEGRRLCGKCWRHQLFVVWTPTPGYAVIAWYTKEEAEKAAAQTEGTP